MSVDCREFRRRVGAEPQVLDPASRTHLLGCPACVEWRRTTLDLDRRILSALEVSVPPAAGRAPVPLARTRWFALAASILAGVAVGTLLWVGGSRETLAGDLVRHLAHEPGAMAVTSTPADPDAVAAVLADARVRLAPGAGVVSYASTCRFRGHEVPHLVVQAAGGPVTVMILRHEHVQAVERFHEGGYAGTLLPAGPGSVAVIGRASDPDLPAVAARVAAAIGWE
ncbi:MAG: DUF3379 family protein [Steroidobacteraceae bacterium]